MADGKGRTALVTGATDGVGRVVAGALAKDGWRVLVHGRDRQRGETLVREIEKAGGSATFLAADLASLAEVRRLAAEVRKATDRLDLLINNAGVMALPQRQTTADGFEMQLGTNYLGHYALTAHLLPLLRRGHQPRVVNLSSLAHRSGAIHFDDLQSTRSYAPGKAYCQSKLAMLIFALELQRRSDAAGWGLMSNAAHPGFARTDLIANGPGNSGLLSYLGRALQPFASHSAAAGALPTLFAATSSAAKAAGYYGPNGFYEMKGPPSPVIVQLALF